MIKLKGKSKDINLAIKPLVVILMVICIVTACQPTPEEPVVIQRDNFENLVENTPEIDAESDINNDTSDSMAHITWQDETKKTTDTPRGKFTTKTYITVDAMVDLSPKTAPVYLVEPSKFDISFVQNAVDYFFNGEYYDPIRTKDDLLMQILLLEPIVPTIYENQRQPAEYDLALRKEKYQTAPESNQKIELTFDYGNDEILCIKGYPYKNAISELFVKTGDISDMVMYYCVDDIDRHYGETKHEYSGVPVLGMSTSYADAKQFATEAVNELYGDEMAWVQTTIANRGRLGENWVPISGVSRIGRQELGTMDQGYVFYFTRTYNEIPQLYAQEASNNDDAESEYGGYVFKRSWDYEYSMKWPAEYIMVIVDDTGIVEFWGFSPTNKVEMVNENVAMLEFDKIFDRFKQNIYYNSIWSDANTKELNIRITDIKFGMIRVPQKDNPDIYYMVPSWQFIGSKSEDTYEGNTEETGKTFMVLNAIDGSVIDVNYYENARLDTIKYLGEDHIYINNMDVIPSPEK